MPYLGIFGLEFESYFFVIEISNPWICLIAKFCEKLKMPKFETENALFRYF